MASIRKRGENSYQLTVSKGYDTEGKKLFSTKTITLDPGLTQKQSDKELAKLSAEFEREVETGQYLDGGKLTFAEFTVRWLNDYAQNQLAPKTLFRYKEDLVGVLSSIKKQVLNTDE